MELTRQHSVYERNPELNRILDKITNTLWYRRIAVSTFSRDIDWYLGSPFYFITLDDVVNIQNLPIPTNVQMEHILDKAYGNVQGRLFKDFFRFKSDLSRSLKVY